MMHYRVVLKRASNGTVVATFPDVPEAHTVGNDEAQALARAPDALETALAIYVDERRDLPRPARPRKGQRAVTLPPMAAAKLAIYQAMRDQGVTQVALARRLGRDPKDVRRLLDLMHRSRLDRLEAALAALGKRLVIEVRDAA
ncbi:MAG: type II toxin-antitoxin system HicB family antitoxin [Proteobacteria bacterium]|nr:type II toxin-antitoxin system HicB family antitoxin [Pseudomonadota bacterium]